MTRLIEAAWEGEPPPTVAEQVANGMSALRREMGRHEPSPRIERGPAGYTLDLAGHELDLDLFRRWVARAHALADRADLAGAVAALTDAVGLWRGAALAGLDTLALRAAAERFDELKLAALEDLGWLELRRGNPDPVTRFVAELVARHPVRERLVALLMFALLRAGRRAEALIAYGRLRASLVAQLGIEPQPELADLHRSILRGRRLDATDVTLGRSSWVTSLEHSVRAG